MTDSTYEVHLSRYFDAPPSMVYAAFVDPDQLTQWFAPLAFHVPRSSVSVDARPGGHWKLTMVNNFEPDQQSPIDTTFVEVVPGSLLVGYEVASGFPGVEDGTKLWMNVEFLPEGDGTRLELRQGRFPEEMRDAAQVGWNQALYKLAALLDTPRKFRTAPEQPDQEDSQ
jgi:uncharacterized protein YndB with AHSA1/START domain